MINKLFFDRPSEYKKKILEREIKKSIPKVRGLWEWEKDGEKKLGVHTKEETGFTDTDEKKIKSIIKAHDPNQPTEVEKVLQERKKVIMRIVQGEGTDEDADMLLDWLR